LRLPHYIRGPTAIGITITQKKKIEFVNDYENNSDNGDGLSNKENEIKTNKNVEIKIALMGITYRRSNRTKREIECVCVCALARAHVTVRAWIHRIWLGVDMLLLQVC